MSNVNRNDDNSSNNHEIIIQNYNDDAVIVNSGIEVPIPSQSSPVTTTKANDSGSTNLPTYKDQARSHQVNIIRNYDIKEQGDSAAEATATIIPIADAVFTTSTTVNATHNGPRSSSNAPTPTTINIRSPGVAPSNQVDSGRPCGDGFIGNGICRGSKWHEVRAGIESLQS